MLAGLVVTSPEPYPIELEFSRFYLLFFPLAYRPIGSSQECELSDINIDYGYICATVFHSDYDFL